MSWLDGQKIHRLDSTGTRDLEDCLVSTEVGMV